MHLTGFIKALNAKGLDLFMHFPPISALRKPLLSNEFFLFTCDDLSEKTDLSDLKGLAWMLKKFKVKGTFFVIPKVYGKTLSKEKAAEMTAILKGHEIAQHGLTHERNEIVKEKKETRKKLVSEGKKILEERFGKKVDGYRSPRFHLHRGREKELKENGFLYSSDSYFFKPKTWKTAEGLRVVPAESVCDPIMQFQYSEEKAMEFTEKMLKRIEEKKFFVFLFHIQSFGEGKKILEKILGKVKEKNIETGCSLKEFVEKLEAKGKG